MFYSPVWTIWCINRFDGVSLLPKKMVSTTMAKWKETHFASSETTQTKTSVAQVLIAVSVGNPFSSRLIVSFKLPNQ
jgi:hypothetical protein